MWSMNCQIGSGQVPGHENPFREKKKKKQEGKKGIILIITEYYIW